MATKTTPKIQPKVTPPMAEPAKIISTDDLVHLLMDIRGATFITFVHDTSMSKSGKMNKGGRKLPPNPHFGDCFKKQQVNGTINFLYDPAVLRRLEKEGKSPDDFRKGESWHELIKRADGTLTPFARHKKDPRKIYLRFMLNNATNVHYHKADGSEIPFEEIKPWVCKRSEYENQGLEKPLIFQCWGIEDIKEITVDGQHYIVQG